ncbi:BQ2448_4119 [Microbotryum intermedium]|uniref:BQ2448_4119 protein n=1 Tax=Microbotryum intermedium TaxID=269621 RepID=A0A238FFK1_9BASI|nr:BQ2448_4119 [Microbotryum intermedium]
MRLLVLSALTLSIAVALLQIVSSVNSHEAVAVLKGLQDGAFLPLNGTRLLRPVTASTSHETGATKRSRRATLVLEGFESAVASALLGHDESGDRSSFPSSSRANGERSPSALPASTWKRTVGVVTNQPQTSTLNAPEGTDDDVELMVSEACATSLNQPIEWILRLKITSVTLASFQLWMLIILGVAWYQASNSHLGAVALSQTLVSIFAIAQVVRTYKFHANFANQILLGPCSLGQPLIPDFWSLMFKTQIAFAVSQPLGSIAIGVFLIKLTPARMRSPNLRADTFSSLQVWDPTQPLDHYGASNAASQRAQLFICSFELLSTSSIFFVLAFQAIWLRETIYRPSPAFDHASTWLGMTEQIGVGVLVVLGTYVMAMGQVGLRYRFRSVMILSLLGNLGFLAHTICLLSQSTFRAVQASSCFLSFLLILSTALVLFTTALGSTTLFVKEVWSTSGAVSLDAHSNNSYHDSETKSSDLEQSNASSRKLNSPVIVDYCRSKAQSHRSPIFNRSSSSVVSHPLRHSHISSTLTVNTTRTWKESLLGRQRSRSMSLELDMSRMIPVRSLGSQSLAGDEPGPQSLRFDRMAPNERSTILGMAEQEFVYEVKDETDLFRRVTPRRLRNPSKASLDVPMSAIPDLDTLGTGEDDLFRPVTPRRLRQPSVPLDASESEHVESIMEVVMKRTTRAVDPFVWTTEEPFSTTITPPKAGSSAESNISPEVESTLSPTSHATPQATPSPPSPALPIRAPKPILSEPAIPTTILSSLPNLSLSEVLLRADWIETTTLPILQITDDRDRHGHDYIPLRPFPQAQIYDRFKTHRVRSIDESGAQVKSNERPLPQPSKKYSVPCFKPIPEASAQASKGDRPKSSFTSTPRPQPPTPRDLTRESVMERPHPVVYQRWTRNWNALE